MATEGGNSPAPDLEEPYEDEQWPQLRDWIHHAQAQGQLPSCGVRVRLRHLHFQSQPLYAEGNTLQYLARQLNLPARLRDRWAPDPARCRQILQELDLDIPAGSMTLIIGSPSSGKSSLCKILAHQDVGGRVTGELLFDGAPLHARDHTHRVAYVRDVDTHLSHLTVRETLEFADAMLCAGMSRADRTQKVAMFMNILGLAHRADTIVGDDLTRGLSGGERRRLTVGVELMKRCQLLLMDEATTGLDSTTSLQIFRALRVVADEMATVVAALKQPGRELYELFDHVIVLHEGHVAYYGPCEEMLAYFQAAGFSVNPHVNPADEALALLGTHGDDMVTAWQESLHTQQAQENDDYGPLASREAHSHPLPVEVASGGEDGEASGGGWVYHQYSRSMIMQYGWGVIRGLQLIKNNPRIVSSRVVAAILMSLIFGTMFLQVGHEQSAIIALQGILFMVVSFPAFQALAALPSLFATRPVFYYQRDNHYYRPFPLLLANFTCTAPVTAIESIVFATICYWLIGFHASVARYVYFVLMVGSLMILFSMITVIASFVLPDFLIANIIIPPGVFILNFFTGFAVREDHAPWVLRWLYYASPFRWLMEGLTINEMVDREFECRRSELIPPASDPRLEWAYAAGGFEGHQICPITSGRQVLEMREYETEWAYAWYWFAALQLYLGVAFVMMFLASYWTYTSQHWPDLTRTQERKAHEKEQMQVFREALDRGGHIHRMSWAVKKSRLPDLNSIPALLADLNVPDKGRLQNNVPVTLEWKDVSYTVRVAPREGLLSKLANLPFLSRCLQKDLRLLQGVSGYVRPGMLIAFLGPSGAGKTTLLDVLAGRKTSGRIEGSITINGAPADPATLARFAGYVEQQNLHIETDTVEEALLFSASLRLSYPQQVKEIRGHGRVSGREIQAHVEWVMDILSLSSVREVLVAQLSLEQKKRLTIGVELAANPSLLWLDEPTSGLDAMAALCVMHAIKRIADSGVAVVCTLHQPSELLFSWCTHLLLLAPTGQVIYFGQKQNKKILRYFGRFGLQPHGHQNDADFFLDCCSSPATNKSGESIVEAYPHSNIARQLEEKLDRGVVQAVPPPKSPWYSRLPFQGWRGRRSSDARQNSESDSDDAQKLDVWDLDSQPPQFSSPWARSMWVQWWHLTVRNTRFWWRSPGPLVVMTAKAILFGIILGVLFVYMDHSQQGAQEHVAIFFFLVLILTTSVMIFIPQFFLERTVFYREVASKTYTSPVYLLGILGPNLCLLFMNSLFTAFFTWVIADLARTWWQISYMWAISVAIALAAYGWVLVVCCLVPVAELANSLFTVVNVLNILTNGFLLLRTRIPDYWIWVYWIAYQHYGLEGLVLNELHHHKFHCEDDEFYRIPVPSASDPARTQLYCQYRTGQDVLDRFEAHDNDVKVANILALVGFFFVLVLIAMFIISKVRHITR